MSRQRGLVKKTQERRKFGTIRTQKTKSGEYVQARFKTPKKYLDLDPTLPEWQTKSTRKEYESDLIAWLAKAEAEIRADVWQPTRIRRLEEKRETLTFKEYSLKWLDNRRKPNGERLRVTTASKHREELEMYLWPMLGDKSVDSIRISDVQRWYDEFPLGKEGRGKTSRKNAYSLLHAIMNTAATQPMDDSGMTLIEKSPCVIKVETPQVQHRYVIAEPDELDTVARAMPGHLSITIYLAGEMGLREGEVCGLQRRDIDLENAVVHVRHAVKEIKMKGVPRRLELDVPKTRKSVRTVPIPEHLLPILRHHLEAYVGEAPDSMVITPGRGGRYVAPQSLRGRWYVARKAVPRFAAMRFHDLRHTAFTQYAAAGATLGELRDIAGHEKLETVGTYQQISGEHMKKVMRNVTQNHYGSILDECKPEPEPEPTAEIKTAMPESPALAGLLSAMQPEAIGAALANMDEEQKKQILAALPAETVQQVLLATLSK